MKLIPTGVTRAVAKKALEAKVNSPHIFFGLGVVGVVGAGFLACRATLKLDETMDEVKEEIETVKSMGEHPRARNYSESDYKKDLGFVYGKGALKLGRLYGPSIVIGGLSIAALTGSHVQLARRNTALAAALSAVSKAFEEYRGRIQKEIGESRERELYHNLEVVEIDGVPELVPINDTNGISVYARFFDEASYAWQKDPEMNKVFLKAQQNWNNDRLQARGYLFLNEVYESLGLELSRAGAVCGWVIENHPDSDNYVDFGLFNARANHSLVNNYERSVLLDFNVDGVIIDRIP